MKSMHVHYINKYPGGSVECSEDRLDAYDAEGRHCLALRKDGGGAMQDKSSEFGLPHSHDMSPIPKEARLYKFKDGKIQKDEKFEDRKKMVEKFMDDGRVLSCEQLMADGKMAFDKDHSLKA